MAASEFTAKIAKLKTALENVFLKKNLGSSNGGKSVATDNNGNIITEAKNNHTHNYIPNNADGSTTGNLTATTSGKGIITANSFKKNGGTSSQFLKADGSIDSNVYIHTAGTNLSKSNNTLNHATSGVGAKSNGLYKTTIDAQGHITTATTVEKTDITGLGISASDHTHSAYVNPTIADNLTTNNASQVLSAKQGYILNNQDAEYVEGTHGTTATGSWTGTCTKLRTIQKNSVILFKMTSAGKGDASLTLTLADGSTFGPKEVWYNTYYRFTTHLPQYTVLNLVYDGTKWINTGIQNTNNYDRTYACTKVKNGENGQLNAYTLIYGKNNGKYYKLASGGVLDVRFQILYNNANIAKDGVSYNVYTFLSGVNIQNTISGITRVANEALYIEGSIFTDGQFTITSNVLVSESSVASGKYYIPIGAMENTTSLRFTGGIPKVFYHNGTKLVPVEDNKYATTSHTHSYVPTSAIKNDLTTGGSTNVLSAEQGKTLQTNKLNKNTDDTSTGYITAKGFKVSGKSNFLKADGTTADANNYSHPTYTSKTNGLYKITVDGTGHVSGTASVSGGDLPSHTHTDTQLTYTGATKNSVSPIDLAIYNEFNANRLAFLKKENIIVEYTTNGTATTPTWTAFPSSRDNDKVKLVTTNATFWAGNKSNATDNASADNQVRVILDAGGVYNSSNSDIYMNTRKILVYFGSGGGTNCKCKVEYSLYNTPTTWVTTGTYDVDGWNGWNSIPFNPSIGWGGYSNQLTTRIRYIRLTFYNSSAKNVSINKIRMIGETCYTPSSSSNSMASEGHMYTYDIDKNVTFPAKIIKSGGTTSQFLKANGDVDSNVYIHTAGTNLSKSNNTLNHATSGVGAKSSGLYKTTIDAQGHITAATAVEKADITGLGIPAQDTTYTAATATPKVDSYTGAVGSATKYAREDHTHPVIYSTCPKGNATYWYLKIMTITVTGTYMDKPIAFDLLARRPRVHHVELSFVNENSTDPQVRKLIVSGGDSRFWIAKRSASTWDIYVRKQELHDTTNITNLQYGNGFTITFPNEEIETLPTTNILEALYERDNVGVNLLRGTKSFTGGVAEYKQDASSHSAIIESDLYNGCVVKRFNYDTSKYQQFSWAIPKEWLQTGEIYTLSFWAKSDTTHGYVKCFFYNGIQSKRLKSNGVIGDWGEGGFGDGGTQFYVSHGWTRYFVTYQLNTTGTSAIKNIAIRLNASSGSSNNIYVAGVKFEKGDQATKYSESPFDAKLAVSQSIATDASGNIITESKNNHGHGKLSSGGVINYDAGNDASAVNKIVVTDSSNNLRTFPKTGKEIGIGSYINGVLTI